MTEKWEHQSLADIAKSVEKAINRNPGPIAGTNVIYQFDITGEEAFQLHLQDGTATVVQDTSSPAACTLKMSVDSFKRFLTGS